MKARKVSIILFVLLVSALFPIVAFAHPNFQTSPSGLTADEISAAAAMLVSVFFAYLPFLNVWYEGLDNKPNGGTWKRLIVFGSLLVVSGAAYGLSCAGWLYSLFGVQLVCTQAGLLGLLRSFAFALIANQSTFLILPKSPGVNAMKAARKGTADLGIGRG